jgi:hypothetical protein
MTDLYNSVHKKGVMGDEVIDNSTSPATEIFFYSPKLDDQNTSLAGKVLLVKNAAISITRDSFDWKQDIITRNGTNNPEYPLWSIKYDKNSVSRKDSNGKWTGLPTAKQKMDWPQSNSQSYFNISDFFGNIAPQAESKRNYQDISTPLLISAYIAVLFAAGIAWCVHISRQLKNNYSRSSSQRPRWQFPEMPDPSLGGGVGGTELDEIPAVREAWPDMSPRDYDERPSSNTTPTSIEHVRGANYLEGREI